MYPDTRGRISTDSTASNRPVNSSHSFTSFSTTVTTLTGNGGASLFAGDLLQSTTIRDIVANAATVSILSIMISGSCIHNLKNANNSWLILFSKIVHCFLHGNGRLMGMQNPDDAVTNARAVASAEPLIGLTREDYPNYYDFLSIIFSKVKQKPRVVEEHDSFSGIISAVEAGTGITISIDVVGYSFGNRVTLC